MVDKKYLISSKLSKQELLNVIMQNPENRPPGQENYLTKEKITYLYDKIDLLELSGEGENSFINMNGGLGDISYERLDSWDNYSADKYDWVLSAYLGNDLNLRVTALEGGQNQLTNIQVNYLNDLMKWWKWDPIREMVYSPFSVYSLGEISAYGAGTGSEGSGSGSGGATLLDDLNDVTIVNPLNNQFLVYNTITHQWENQTISFTPTSHSHSISDITGLQNNLNLKTDLTLFYSHTSSTVVHLTQEDRDYINNLKTWWNFDTGSQKLWTPYDVYSEGEISAYGAGSGSGSDSGSISYDRLDAWVDYDPSKSGWVLSAYLGNDLNTRVTTLENESNQLTSTQINYLNDLMRWWKWDSVNNAVYSPYDVYSEGEISAYGAGTGSEGSGSGGLIQTVYGYSDLGGVYNNNILTDTFNAYTINQLASRISSLEGETYVTLDTNQTITGIKTFTNGIITPSVDFNNLWEIKSSGSELQIYYNNTKQGVFYNGGFYSTGELSAYGAGSGSGGTGGAIELNDLVDVTITSPTPNQILQYIGGQWINVSSDVLTNSYTLLSTFNDHVNSNLHITSTERNNWNTAFTYYHTHSNKVSIDQITPNHINVLNRLFIDGDFIKITGSAYSTGELSAYGAGSGSGGSGGATFLDDLTDVVIAGAASNQILQYIDGFWKNVDPNFSSTTGTVTSVGLKTSVPGLAVGSTPVTTSGSLLIGYAVGYSIPTDASQSNWSLAYNHSTSSHAPSNADNTSTTLLNSTSTNNIVDNDSIVYIGASSYLPQKIAWSNIKSTLKTYFDTLYANPITIDTTLSSTSTNPVQNKVIYSALSGKAATNQQMYIGTTAFVINRSSAIQTLSGVSIDGNAATATIASKLGSSTIGSSTLPIYLNAGTATAITQADLRIGLFGTAEIGSTYQPIYIAANGVPTAITGIINNSTTGNAATATSSSYATNATTATKLSSVRTFALTGDVTGTITSDLTSGFSIATTIAPNSVALGTDTTGNYVGSVGVSGNGLTITGTAGEGTTFTVNSNATSLNTANTLVFRDASGNFSAGTITATTANFTNLTTNYLPKQTASGLANSMIYDNGTNVGIGTAVPTEKVEILGSAFINNGSLYIGSKLSRMSTNLTNGSYDFNYNTGATGQLAFYGGGTTSVWNVDALGNGYFSGNVGIGTTTPTTTLDVNGTGKFKDDILMTFNTWTHATDKNSLKKFLGLFDIDAAGNLVVKTNLYSMGEVTAYSSGTGVSGLKLMADMNANGKNIIGANNVSAGDIVIGNDPLSLIDNVSPGIYCSDNDSIIAAYSPTPNRYLYANGNVYFDIATMGLVTTKMNAGEFKFGNWSFKEVSGNMVIYYNGTAKATIQSSRTNSNL